MGKLNYDEVEKPGLLEAGTFTVDGRARRPRPPLHRQRQDVPLGANGPHRRFARHTDQQLLLAAVQW